VGLILGWVAGIAACTAVAVLEEPRPVALTSWQAWTGSAVISLGLLEVWRTHGQIIWVPIIPHTLVGAFAGGYLSDLAVAGLLKRLLRRNSR
jgi:hypothetical protein